MTTVSRTGSVKTFLDRLDFGRCIGSVWHERANGFATLQSCSSFDHGRRGRGGMRGRGRTGLETDVSVGRHHRTLHYASHKTMKMRTARWYSWEEVLDRAGSWKTRTDEPGMTSPSRTTLEPRTLPDIGDSETRHAFTTVRRAVTPGRKQNNGDISTRLMFWSLTRPGARLVQLNFRHTRAWSSSAVRFADQDPQHGCVSTHD